jgi:uncharacterized protein (DUF362 family)
MAHDIIPTQCSRRGFLSKSIAAGAGLGLAPMLTSADVTADIADVPTIAASRSNVALTHGNNRRDNIRKALELIGDEIRRDIGNRQVVIKPNCVTSRAQHQLAVTHTDALRGIMDFLQPFYKKRVMIAENSATKAADAYVNFGYPQLTDEYNVTLHDLDEFDTRNVHILDKHLRPHPIKVSALVMNPTVYVMSVALMKVHNLVVATLAVKNIAMGAPVSGNREKVKMHQAVLGKEFRNRPRDPLFNKGINYNMFRMMHYVKPSLAIIDAFEGMERSGPIGGDMVPMHAAVASTDCIAADRVGVELMGLNFDEIGYLTYCAQAHMGHGDMAKIDILGERIAAVKRPFKPHEIHAQQIVW